MFRFLQNRKLDSILSTKCNVDFSEKMHTKVKHIRKLKYPGATVKFTEWGQEQWADHCAKISRKKKSGFLTVRQGGVIAINTAFVTPN